MRTTPLWEVISYGTNHCERYAVFSSMILYQKARVTSICFLFIYLFIFWTQGLTLTPRVECDGVITADCRIYLPGSSDPTASASQNVEITVMSHCIQLFYFLIHKMYRFSFYKNQVCIILPYLADFQNQRTFFILL